MKTRFKDWTGIRVGRLVPQWPVGRRGKSARIVWLCVCDCGTLTTVYANHLKSAVIRSCGCILREQLVAGNVANPPNLKHGHSRGGKTSREYSSWENMHQRCTNPKTPGWEWYGGRGIRVCDSWADFVTFLVDMGPRPLGMSLDRYPDMNGNYEPGNCRWATPLEQRTNSRPRGTV